MFVDGRLWVTSKRNEFIDAFVDEWVGWDGTKSKTGHDDCLDAVYWMAYVAQGHLAPTASRARDKRTRTHVNPYDALTQSY